MTDNTRTGDYLRKIVEEYRGTGQKWPATSNAIAAWAIENKKMDVPRRNAIMLCVRELAQAMREDFFADPQNRRVRRKHVVPETIERPDGSHEQFLLWVDILDANPDQMQRAFQYRRNLVLGDCRHLKTDVDSYNDNNRDGAHIQMIFNFTNDLLESELVQA
jgi:hypothetical protein